MSTPTFDPSKLVLNIAAQLLTGFKSIKISRDEKTWQYKTSTDGKRIRIKNLNRQGTFEVVVQQDSHANDILSALVGVDDLTNAGEVPCALLDGNGTTVAAATNACVEAPAEVTYDKEDQDRTWTIKCADLRVFVGGII